MVAGNSGWQTSVNTVPAPAVAGDFCDTNPRYTVDAGPGGFVAGSLGVTIGRFAWSSYAGIDPDNAPTIVNSFGSGVPTGFVHREMQGLITTYLDWADQGIPQGFPVTLFAGGGFWVKNEGTTQATIGMKAYASLSSGAVSFAATGAASSASATGTLAAGTASITGSVSGNVLNVTVLTSGTIFPGSLVYGTVGGTGVIAGTFVVSQLSGTIGGVGTYSVSVPEQNVSSGSLSLSFATLNLSAVSSGTIGVGGAVTGTGVSAGTVLTALGTGTGGTGTYIVNSTQTMSSSAVTIGTTVETRFSAASSGLAGELVKMSDRITA